jgi:predicted secreted protein
MEPVDTNKIKLIDVTSVSKNRRYTVGGNVIEIWKFTGLQKGTFWLSFYYKRKWMDETETTEQVKVIIE